MSITALGNQDPMGPVTWEDAAALTSFQIFSHIDAAVRFSQNNAFSDELIKIQFEGMYMNSQAFMSDNMYWAEEWKILGSIAAAAGVMNAAFPWKIFEKKDINLAGSAAGTQKYVDFSHSLAYPAFSQDIKKSKEYENMCAHVIATLCKKQHDYGHENIARFGRTGLLVRVHDKIARLNNLLSRGVDPANETIEDTYVDIVGYSAIGMMVERGWFGLQLSQ